MQIKIIIGLVITLALLGWFAKYQTEQLGEATLALRISEQTVTELRESRVRLDGILVENANENDRINLELSAAHGEWRKVRDEISTTNNCVNAVIPAAALAWLRNHDQPDNKGQTPQ